MVNMNMYISIIYYYYLIDQFRQYCNWPHTMAFCLILNLIAILFILHILFRALSVIKSGTMRVRIDIDTSVGDLTYTSIKNSLPMIKELVKDLSVGLDLSLPIPLSEVNAEDNSNNMTISSQMIDTTIKNTFAPERTLNIFFPDMGAAALARRDWKFGTVFPEVPPCVNTANIQNDVLKSTDQLAIILCPRYSETDYVQRVMDLCDEKGIPCLLINPSLINMDQGYGVRKFTHQVYMLCHTHGALCFCPHKHRVMQHLMMICLIRRSKYSQSYFGHFYDGL